MKRTNILPECSSWLYVMKIKWGGMKCTGICTDIGNPLVFIPFSASLKSEMCIS